MATNNKLSGIISTDKATKLPPIVPPKLQADPGKVAQLTCTNDSQTNSETNISEEMRNKPFICYESA